ncbi:MAG: hypothetical protein V1494_02135 [Candidatus Diapherotrites archaeon]
MIRSEKIFLLDFDGVLTNKLGKYDEAAFQRVASLVGRGYKVAIITGREGHSLFGEGSLFEALKKHAIEKDTVVFAARGLYRVFPDGRRELSREAKRFYEKGRKKAADYIKDKLVEYNASVEANKRIPPKRKEQHKLRLAPFVKQLEEIQLWYSPEHKVTPAELDKLKRFINKTISDIYYDTGLELNPIYARDGISLLPGKMNKTLGAKQAIKILREKRGQALSGKRYLARAMGDSPEDMAMALGKNAKFVHVRNPEEFIRETRFLPARFLYQLRPFKALTVEKKWNLRKIKRSFGRKK